MYFFFHIPVYTHTLQHIRRGRRRRNIIIVTVLSQYTPRTTATAGPFTIVFSRFFPAYIILYILFCIHIFLYTIFFLLSPPSFRLRFLSLIQIALSDAVYASHNAARQQQCNEHLLPAWSWAGEVDTKIRTSSTG